MKINNVSSRSMLPLLQEIRSCEACASYLKLPPKPVVQLDALARVLVIAQAPGARARASGRPFDDPSGDRLRTWLGIDREQFYDPTRFAFMPMGFCYPGSAEGGDLPPCKDCAPRWHPRITPHLTNVKLTLLVGSYAHRYYLQSTSVTEAVKSFRQCLPSKMPLPHPSWHNTNWLKNNPWFLQELVPELKALIKEIF